MHKDYGREVEFFLVYIREAHPTDGWQVGQNQKEEILFEQPKTLKAREEIAGQMCSVLKINLPTLIDKLDDKVAQDYSAWPDRMYLVDKDGKVQYKGKPGPAGFKPDELETAILKVLVTQK